MTKNLNNILIQFAHPKLERSRAQRILLEAIPNREGITINDLYEKYPQFDIDVAEEQALLTAHDLIVWQYPLYWYSYPAMLKEWIDMVLRPGWAYGNGGEALKGKYLLNVLSIGGSRQAYSREGVHHFTVREFLAPQEQTARLCQMRYLPPFVLHETTRLADPDLRGIAGQYGRLLDYLADYPIPAGDWEAVPYLNDWFTEKQPFS